MYILICRHSTFPFATHASCQARRATHFDEATAQKDSRCYGVSMQLRTLIFSWLYGVCVKKTSETLNGQNFLYVRGHVLIATMTLYALPGSKKL